MWLFLLLIYASNVAAQQTSYVAKTTAFAECPEQQGEERVAVTAITGDAASNRVDIHYFVNGQRKASYWCGPVLKYSLYEEGGMPVMLCASANSAAATIATRCTKWTPAQGEKIIDCGGTNWRTKYGWDLRGNVPVCSGAECSQIIDDPAMEEELRQHGDERDREMLQIYSKRLPSGNSYKVTAFAVGGQLTACRLSSFYNGKSSSEALGCSGYSGAPQASVGMVVTTAAKIENCGDGIDDDKDGLIDGQDTDCRHCFDNQQNCGELGIDCGGNCKENCVLCCSKLQPEICNNDIDDDADGLVDECVERCFDGIDYELPKEKPAHVWVAYDEIGPAIQGPSGISGPSIDTYFVQVDENSGIKSLAKCANRADWGLTQYNEFYCKFEVFDELSKKTISLCQKFNPQSKKMETLDCALVPYEKLQQHGAVPSIDTIPVTPTADFIGLTNVPGFTKISKLDAEIGGIDTLQICKVGGTCSAVIRDKFLVEPQAQVTGKTIGSNTYFLVEGRLAGDFVGTQNRAYWVARYENQKWRVAKVVKFGHTPTTLQFLAGMNIGNFPLGQTAAVSITAPTTVNKGQDNDADGFADEGCEDVCFNAIDDDGDGQIDEYCKEICGNRIDDDKDGIVDNGCPSEKAIAPACADDPGQYRQNRPFCNGNGICDFSEGCNCADCSSAPFCKGQAEYCNDKIDNDGDDAINECCAEICYDRIDNDGDGLTDERDCKDLGETTLGSALESYCRNLAEEELLAYRLCSDRLKRASSDIKDILLNSSVCLPMRCIMDPCDNLDNDRDGLVDEDCVEVCYDNLDNDRDGKIDEGCCKNYKESLFATIASQLLSMPDGRKVYFNCVEEEICGNNLDDDGDFSVDEGCRCGPGSGTLTPSSPSGTQIIPGYNCKSTATSASVIRSEYDTANCACSPYSTGPTIKCTYDIFKKAYMCDCSAYISQQPQQPLGRLSGVRSQLSRPCGLLIGNCRTGTQRCVSGIWDICREAKLPTEEICANFIDDNCNGFVDEGCSCGAGAVLQDGICRCPVGTTMLADGSCSPSCAGGECAEGAVRQAGACRCPVGTKMISGGKCQAECVIG